MMIRRLNQRLWLLSGITLLISLLASILMGCGVARGTPAATKTPAPSPAPKAAHQALYVGFAGTLIAFRASDGNALWTHPNNGGFYSPVVDGDMLYTGADNEVGAQLLALRAGDGAVIWKTALDRPTWAAPVLSDGVLYTTTRGSAWSSSGPSSSLYALDAQTGRILWRFQTAGNLYPTPQIAGDVIYAAIGAVKSGLGGYSTTVIALNRHNGSVRWRTVIDEEISAPLVAHGAIYFSVYKKSLNALNAATGAQLWKRSTPDWVVWITATDGDVLYTGMDGGKISALRPSDGAPLWTSTLPGGFDHYVDPSVAVRGGLMYVGSLSGYVAVLDAATGATRWRVCIANDSCDTPTDAADWSTPLVADGTIYMGVTMMHWHPVGESPGDVFALDATTGGILWQYHQFGGEVGTPALADI
ncbi:MAG TPA: PQQ-binding-like beta-propeller repeat protein [Ktedonobacterales bacterium]|nr:PQQ-binding-like beta-propeller repeat protein [Ktedonobacterales bacterium]